MVYGNYGDNSFTGNYYTRNIITGDPEIQGDFLKNEFDMHSGKTTEIKKIDKEYFEKFTRMEIFGLLSREMLMKNLLNLRSRLF